MALEHDCHALPDRGARRIRAPGDLTPSSTPIAVRRSQQRRVPRQPRRASPAASKSFRLPKQAQVSSVIFQAQYQAFVRFAVKGSAAFSSHRAQRDLLLWNLYSGRAHSLEILALTPTFGSQRPCTDVGWNVVAPGEYSKWFFCIPIRHYRGSFRPATARGMPAKSALGGPADVNPAADINSPTGPLWP